ESFCSKKKRLEGRDCGSPCQRCRRSRGSFGVLRPCQVGLRAGGSKAQRPSGRRALRSLPFGGSCRWWMHKPLGRGRSGLFGGLPGRHRRPGCPADPGFRREGAGPLRPSPFRQGRLPFLRVGEPVDPGPRGFRKGAARRSQGPATCPQGLLVSLPGRRVSDVLGETWEAEGELRLPFVARTGSFGTPPVPRKGTAATARDS